MSKPIAPLVCDPATARFLGAVLYAGPPRDPTPIGRVTAIIEAASRIGDSGDIPVMTHGDDLVFAWPVQPGARHSGAGI